MELNLICDRRSGERVELLIITYNEEKRIASFINYYKGSADIVIFDDSSTDQTCAIAQSLGASVYQRTGSERGENHIVYYLDHLSKVKYGICMYVDELIPISDLLAADRFLKLRKGVVYGKRIDYMFGHKTRAFISCAPRGFCLGSVKYDSSTAHSSYIITQEFRLKPVLTIEMQHLQVWYFPDTMERGGRYTLYDLRTLLKGKHQLFKFLKMFVYPIAKFIVKGFWKEPLKISSYYLSLLCLNLFMAIPCYLELKWFLGKEEQIELYNKMFESRTSFLSRL